MIKNKNNQLLFSDNQIEKKSVFQNQKKLALALKLIIAIVIFVYSTITIIAINDFISFSDKKPSILESNIAFFVNYVIYNFFAFYFLTKAYVQINTNYLKLKQFLPWFFVFVLSSILFFVLSLIQQTTKEATTNKSIEMIFANWWIFLFALIVNLAYDIYLIVYIAKFSAKVKYRTKWTLIGYVSKFFYYIFFLLFIRSLIDYGVFAGMPAQAHPLINLLGFDWSVAGIILKTLLLIVLTLFTFPFFMNFMNFWESSQKIQSLNQLYTLYSLSFLFSNLVLFIKSFWNKLLFESWNFVVGSICFVVIIFILIYSIISYFRPQKFHLSLIIVVSSLIIIWFSHFISNAFFNKEADKNEIPLTFSEINLFIVSATTFIITLTQFPKLRLWWKSDRIWFRIVLNIITITLSVVIYLKANELFSVINSQIRLENIFYLLIVISISIFALVLTIKQIKIIASYSKRRI
ncbi:MSC_0624 family F1-like ATPase-associated membrane protein [Mycoplasma procyoni]|uniref:MSC_0624 family F1-like ATPase-associated membrane protein n=1 Tax=Mycoplasma procyoni TaxID=568784 RepID=UPI00197C3516|nr:hypothetical protein [Mycoplasma procyoni]MBN3534778.1 hypothetical protein [Mycoplasma procyoni]